MYKVYASPRDREFCRVLKRFLCRPHTVVACIGTELRNDDAVGILVYNLVDKKMINTILCLHGLENCVSELIKVRAKNILIIDGVVTDAPTGSVILSTLDSINEDYMATTHNIPLSMTITYLRNHGCANDVLITAIVVENLTVGDSITPTVEKTARELSRVINTIIEQCSARE